MPPDIAVADLSQRKREENLVAMARGKHSSSLFLRHVQTILRDIEGENLKLRAQLGLL